jgi:hypothetical protein
MMQKPFVALSLALASTQAVGVAAGGKQAAFASMSFID